VGTGGNVAGSPPAPLTMLWSQPSSQATTMAIELRKLAVSGRLLAPLQRGKSDISSDWLTA